MRKTITITTLNKIKEFFEQNKKEYTITGIRNLTKIDFFSVQIAVEELLKDRYITKIGKKYKYRGGIQI